jgi:hypothetical protein
MIAAIIIRPHITRPITTITATRIPTMNTDREIVATALRAVIEEGLERLNALTEAAPKNLFQFSFVCLRRCH